MHRRHDIVEFLLQYSQIVPALAEAFDPVMVHSHWGRNEKMSEEVEECDTSRKRESCLLKRP